MLYNSLKLILHSSYTLYCYDFAYIIGFFSIMYAKYAIFVTFVVLNTDFNETSEAIRNSSIFAWNPSNLVEQLSLTQR
jgi:hypothetical protein